MNIWDVLIILIVALIVFFAVYMMRRGNVKRCSCGCESCGCNCCEGKQNKRKRENT